MSRIQITAKATTQGRKKQKQTLTTGDLLIENGLVGSDDQDSGKYQVREPRPARASLMSSLVNKPQNDAPECAIEVSGIENQPMSLWG
ncbi:MAG: hypothetical protein ABSA54_10775 [Terriglobales bacterium]|jgi:hypothetical protein